MKQEQELLSRKYASDFVADIVPLVLEPLVDPDQAQLSRMLDLPDVNFCLPDSKADKNLLLARRLADGMCL